MTAATSKAMDADELAEQNEQLQLQNLRFKRNVPKLYKAVVRFSSSYETMRGGVSTQLRQLGSELASHCAALATAVATVDARTRANRSAGEGEHQRLQQQARQLEASLSESQATVQMQQGRMQAMAAELDRKADAHKDMKEIFEEERARADELGHDIAALKRDSSVKDDRISCLEKTQSALAQQLDQARGAAEKERANAVEYQKALQELERTNAVLTSKRGSLEKEAARARESARGAELKVADLEVQVAMLREQLDEAAHRHRELELLHAGELRAGEQGEAAQRRVAELERQASKQRASHTQRLDELQRYYDKELAKSRADGEAAGRAGAEAAARERMAVRERELREAVGAEAAAGAKQLRDEVKALRAQMQEVYARMEEVQRTAAAKVSAAEKDGDNARASRDHALQQVAELRRSEGDLRRQVEQLEEESAVLREQMAGLSREKEDMAARHELHMGPLVTAMEASLKNLSSRLRSKEAETAALKSTVQKECQERMALMAELTFYRSGGAKELGDGGEMVPMVSKMGAASGPALAWGLEHHACCSHCGESGHGGHDCRDFVQSDRAPSCPPELGHKSDKGWGLLPNISRGPSPAQLHDARVTKEQVTRNGGRLRRSRPG